MQFFSVLYDTDSDWHRRYKDYDDEYHDIELLPRQRLALAVHTIADWYWNSVLLSLPWFQTDFCVSVIVNTCRGKSLCRDLGGWDPFCKVYSAICPQNYSIFSEFFDTLLMVCLYVLCTSPGFKEQRTCVRWWVSGGNNSSAHCQRHTDSTNKLESFSSCTFSVHVFRMHGSSGMSKHDWKICFTYHTAVSLWVPLLVWGWASPLCRP